MRFASLHHALWISASLVFISTSGFGQEELIEDNSDNTEVNGMFQNSTPGGGEEELVPIEPDRSRRAPEEIDEGDSESSEDINPVERRRDFSRPAFGGGSPSRPATGSGSTGARKTLNFPDSIPNSSERLRMDFVQVDIEEVVKYFAERLKKKFIYDPSILSGKITIISPTEVTVGEAYQAFLSAMEIRGYVVYPAGAYLKIEKVSEARKSPVPMYSGGVPENDSFVTRIVNLKFLNVRDIRQAVRDLVTRTGGDVIEHAPTNTLIISDYASNIRRIIRILNVLDVEGFQEQIAVIPMKYASASDVARKISEIFPTGSPTAVSSTRRTTRSASAGGVTESVIQKVVADDRTNSLIILGSDRGIEQVRKFIEQIDVEVEGGDGEIHVYPLQNVKAEDIAQTLAALTQSSSSGASAGGINSRVRDAFQGNVRPGLTPPASTARGGTSTANLFDGSVKITGDPRSNSLVIQAAPRDFETLKRIIEKLDIRRRQVFIESIILEAQVGGGNEFGAQASGPMFKTHRLGGEKGAEGQNENSAGVFGMGNLSDKQLAGTLGGLLGSTAITGLALGFRAGGTVGVPIVNPETGKSEIRDIPLLSAIIRLAAHNNKLNVLSTPHILATANEEATISIGQEVPQVKSNQATEAGLPVQTFDRIRVATELTITPQINAGDYITLAISQKVNELGSEVLQGSGQFSTTTREAKTTAIVQDGQTIVIGGIMRDRKTETISKVPFLGDIPILGWLFKSRSSEQEKVNLLLFITPHIIRDTGDMNDVFFRKLKEREGFLSEQGIKEKKGVPFSGYTKEQLNMLDEDYLNSLQLTPLKGASSTVSPPTTSSEQDLETQKKLEETNKEGAERPVFPTIPIQPRSMPEENAPSFQNEDEDSNLPIEPQPLAPLSPPPVEPQVAPLPAPGDDISVPEIDELPGLEDKPLPFENSPSTPGVNPNRRDRGTDPF